MSNTVYVTKDQEVITIDLTKPQMWLLYCAIDGIHILYYFNGKGMYSQPLEYLSYKWSRCNSNGFEHLLKYGELVAYE